MKNNAKKRLMEWFDVAGHAARRKQPSAAIQNSNRKGSLTSGARAKRTYCTYQLCWLLASYNSSQQQMRMLKPEKEHFFSIIAGPRNLGQNIANGYKHPKRMSIS